MGPKPHSFERDMPRTMKRLALRSALSSHALDGSIRVVEGLIPAEGKTKLVQALLDAHKLDRSVLLVSGEHEATLNLAARNIPFATPLPAAYLNVVDVLNAHHILLTEDAVRQIEALWGGSNLKPARGRRVEEAEVEAIDA
jgi:large subunit ribosomal protein L4